MGLGLSLATANVFLIEGVQVGYVQDKSFDVQNHIPGIMFRT